MPRVYPAQIVRLLDTILSSSLYGPGGPPILSSGPISTVIDLMDKLPDEFIIFSGDDYSNYRLGINVLSDLLVRWRDGNAHNGHVADAIGHLRIVRELLSKCPNEVPSKSTAELSFIPETDLRDSIRNDISAANRALAEGLWKGATVLAGAAAEALLRWAIVERRSPTDVEAARVAIIPGANKDPDRWVLGQYIKVAQQLDLVHAETAKQTDLAREFRDLIHPGRATRLAKVCDRGTALSALASVEFIVRDLS